LKILQEIDYKNMPGFSKLFRDYNDTFTPLQDYYLAGNPRELSSYSLLAAKLAKRDYHRSEVIAVLHEQNRRFGAAGKTFLNLEKLADSRTVAVVTGQQAGIYGGPLYTLYKALTTVKLAEKLETEQGIPAVPVFWIASDDHDLREALSSAVLDNQGEIVPLEYDLSTFIESIPVWDAVFNDSINELNDKLLGTLYESEFKAGVAEKLRECYAPGMSVSEAFARWWASWLKNLGLIFVEPSDPRLKQIAKHLFEKEINEYSPSSRAALDAGKELKAAGYHAQLTQREDGFNLFYHTPGRTALRKDGNQITLSGTHESLSPGQWIERLKAHPERFSPNVVLRPLYQDTLFPTIAYVAGPSELAYFAQLSRVYQVFDIPMPYIFPRFSYTLVEQKYLPLLEKYDPQIINVFGNSETLITDVIKRSLPEDMDAPLRKMEEQLKELSSVLQGNVEQWDPTLIKTVETTFNSMTNQLYGLEKKILSAHKKKNDTLRQQLYRLSANLYPSGVYQERVLNIVPWLCKYGPGLIDEIASVVDIASPYHLVGAYTPGKDKVSQ
jgi:bacillithiol biosynthesis cysteine-adding enzyme BshC